jgi:hypothetical protein
VTIGDAAGAINSKTGASRKPARTIVVPNQVSFVLTAAVVLEIEVPSKSVTRPRTNVPNCLL